MKTQVIHSLTTDFESFVHQTEEGIEFWLARDLQKLLGYTAWRNFKNVISKSQIACEASGQKVENHFVDVDKMAIVKK
jgi:DNA-damage-inducible protein D